MNQVVTNNEALAYSGSTSLWLKIRGDRIDRAEGLFPTEWLHDSHIESGSLIARLSPQDVPQFDMATARHLQKIALRKATFVFLISRWEGQEDAATVGPSVESFAVSPRILRRFFARMPRTEQYIPYVDTVLPKAATVGAYELAAHVLDQQRPIPAVQCLQMPYESFKLPQCVRPRELSAEWIIPHKGKLEFLEGCLSSLRTVIGPRDKVVIGFDETYGPEYRRLVHLYPNYRFFESVPCGNGPAVIMDKLWRSSTAEYIFFQDSDDVSCTDRKARLLAAMQQRNLDVVGGHEVRVDDEKKCVESVRFPTDFGWDSMWPLNKHAISIPLSAIRHSALTRAGGFSSTRKFAHDTEFLYRLMTTGARMGNVDEYVFVRRKHANSMTANAFTGHGTASRMEALRAWGHDFHRWTQGSLRAADASFSLTHRPDYKQISMHPILEPAVEAPRHSETRG